MNRIKKNDTVVVIAGADSGKSGKVLRMILKKDQVVIEGINLVYKHVRRSQQNPQGGRIQKEAPIDASNALLYCEKCDKGVRVRFEVKDGVKTRLCRKCSSSLS